MFITGENKHRYSQIKKKHVIHTHTHTHTHIFIYIYVYIYIYIYIPTNTHTYSSIIYAVFAKSLRYTSVVHK
jgi:hypothetical protein